MPVEPEGVAGAVEHVVDLGEQRVALGLGQADDAVGVHLVDVEDGSAGARVRFDHRSLDDRGSGRKVALAHAPVGRKLEAVHVHDRSRFETRPQVVGHPVEDALRIGVHRRCAARRYLERVEREGVDRLGGEREIGVVGQRALAQRAVGAPVRDVAELRGPFRRDGAEMSAQADLLVAAHEVTAEQEQVVLVEGAPQRGDLIRRELAVQVDTPDLCAERVAERDDLHVSRRPARGRDATPSCSRRSHAGSPRRR